MKSIEGFNEIEALTGLSAGDSKSLSRGGSVRKHRIANALNIGFIYLPKVYYRTPMEYNGSQYMVNTGPEGQVYFLSKCFPREGEEVDRGFSSPRIRNVSFYRQRVQSLWGLVQLMDEIKVGRKAYKSLKRLDLLKFTLGIKDFKGLIRKIRSILLKQRTFKSSQPTRVVVKHLRERPFLIGKRNITVLSQALYVPIFRYKPWKTRDYRRFKTPELANKIANLPWEA